jgi:RHS repeat-associated protein
MTILRTYHHPNHSSTWLSTGLASSTWITDGNGQAIQHFHYLPYGEDWIAQRNSSWTTPYTFSGKEKDVETGYGYVKKLRFFSSLAFGNEKQVFHYAHCLRRFGARYYDSGLSIWLSVDPMSDKYPSMSPYNYCANNPVMLVDPDGREFSIAGMIYVPGANCPDEIKDAKDRAIWNTMNKVYSTKYGKKAINEMNEKGVMYNITSDSHPDAKEGSGAYLTNNDGTGGTIYLNGNNDNVDVLAHEMFHGYQDFFGQGSASIQNEVEARLFADAVGFEHLMSSEGSYGRMPQLLAAEGDIPEVFNYNVDKIQKNFNEISMRYLVISFKSHFGGYDKLPLTSKNQKSLIQNFINN